MEVLSASLSKSLGASELRAPAAVLLEGRGDGLGEATGFALEEIPDIPMLPVNESNNPPTDGDARTRTSGSTITSDYIANSKRNHECASRIMITKLVLFGFYEILDLLFHS